MTENLQILLFYAAIGSYKHIHIIFNVGRDTNSNVHRSLLLQLDKCCRVPRETTWSDTRICRDGSICLQVITLSSFHPHSWLHCELLVVYSLFHVDSIHHNKTIKSWHKMCVSCLPLTSGSCTYTAIWWLIFRDTCCMLSNACTPPSTLQTFWTNKRIFFMTFGVTLM